MFRLPREKFCGQGKNSQAVMAKEVLIVAGKDAGATITERSGIVAPNASTVSRRLDAAKQNLEIDSKLAFAKSLVEEKYRARIAELQG